MSIASAHAGKNHGFVVSLVMKRLFIFLLVAVFLCGGVYAQQTDQQKDGQKADQKAVQKADKKDDQTGATAPKDDKKDLLNNAASLLVDLLGQEKNLSKILFIKHPPTAVGQLLKEISKAAGDGHDKIQAMAKSNHSLNLEVMQLPPGEIAARASDAKEEEHTLLSSSGTRFALAVLLTQNEALGYGSNLAKVAADNSSSPEEAKEFQSLNTTFNRLRQQVQGQLRAVSK